MRNVSSGRGKVDARASINIALAQQKGTLIAGGVDSIWQPLYHYQTKAAALATLRFFQDAIGGAAGLTLADTNMELPGQLQKGQSFVYYGIGIELIPDDVLTNTVASTFANDVQSFFDSGSLEFKIGDRSYHRGANLKQYAIPEHYELGSSTTVATDNNTSAWVEGTEAYFELEPRTILSSQSFFVELANMATLSADARVGVRLYGHLLRNSTV